MRVLVHVRSHARDLMASPAKMLRSECCERVWPDIYSEFLLRALSQRNTEADRPLITGDRQSYERPVSFPCACLGLRP